MMWFLWSFLLLSFLLPFEALHLGGYLRRSRRCGRFSKEMPFC